MSHEHTKKFLGDPHGAEELEESIQEFWDMMNPVIAEQTERPHKITAVIAVLEEAVHCFEALSVEVQKAKATLEVLKEGAAA